MISILKTITTSLIPTKTSISKFKFKFMDSSFNATMGGSHQRLLSLAQHLRLYKPPPFPEDILEKSFEENGGKVVSQLGFPESATTIQNPDKFRPNKAAVLICLFEGDAGEFRVILTKRSSKLSTHSGQFSYLLISNVLEFSINGVSNSSFLFIFRSYYSVFQNTLVVLIKGMFENNK